MDDVSWWMYYAASGCFGIAVGFSVWVAYVVMKAQSAIDQLETLILAVLDDALQIMIPTAVLNHISQHDIANFEMKTEGGRGKNKSLKKRFQGEKKGKHLQKDVCYAEDVSQALSEKSQMYNDFGESGPQRKKLTARQMNQLQATHSIEVLVKSPVKKAVTPAQSATNLALPMVSNNKVETKGSRTPETPKKGSSDPMKIKENKPEPLPKRSQLNLATAKEKPSKEKKETPSAQKPGSKAESNKKSKKSKRKESADTASKESVPKDTPAPVAEKATAVNKQPELKLAKVMSKAEIKRSEIKVPKKETGSNQSSTVSEPSKPDEVPRHLSQKPTQMSERSTFSERTQNQEGEGEKKEEKAEDKKN